MDCQGTDQPAARILLELKCQADQFGNSINAGVVGGKIPVEAHCTVLQENGTTKGDGTFYLDNSAVSEVTLGEPPLAMGGSKASGLYGGDYTLPDSPGLNVVNVTCNAMVNGQLQTAEETFAVSGVELRFPYLVDNPEPLKMALIGVNKAGYLTRDQAVSYQILPAGYQAGAAYLYIYKNGKPLFIVPTEKSGIGFATMAKGMWFEAGGNYETEVVLNPGTGVEIRSEKIPLQVVALELEPDDNRDGKIDEKDQGLVTSGRAWRFWVNDDDDGDSDPATGLTTDGFIAVPDDLPGQNEDNGDSQVNGIRDLVDFFPLRLDLAQALTILQPEEGYRYVLRQADAAVNLADPMLQGLVLTADNVAMYLENPATGLALGALESRTVTAAGTELPTAMLKAIRNNPQVGILLVEGRSPTKEPLVLEILYSNGAVALRTDFPLEIVPVEQMFGHKNLRPEAGGDGGEIDRFVNFTDPSNADYYLNSKQPYCMQGIDKNLVWMHGWNVTPEYVEATFAEVFKRFFHSGLNGRFYGVSWYGDAPAPLTWFNDDFPAHFHQSVVNAFATAEAYKNFITIIPGATSIAAHSLGNLVVGSAINDFGLEKFDKYFAIDSAVALEAYGQVSDVAALVKQDGTIDATVPNAGMVNVGEWPKYIAGGQARLLASEWYKCFEGTSDNRKLLTWRNRLKMVPSAKVYNFYSSTEDVLRRYDDDNIVFDGNGWSTAALAISTWVKQEKYKGLRNILNGVDNIGGVSSPYGGWNFSNYYWKFDPLSIDHRRLYTPEEAAGIDRVALKNEPFFAVDNRHLFPNPLSMADPGLDELVSASGSGFVNRLIRDTNLRNYYTDNRPAQDKVMVKDWLLAEAFPATTLPMGANKNGDLRDNNFDMSGVRDNKGGCCKTNEDLWPRKDTYQGKREWRHSDYKDMSYQHVYEFYKKISQ